MLLPSAVGSSLCVGISLWGFQRAALARASSAAHLWEWRSLNGLVREKVMGRSRIGSGLRACIASLPFFPESRIAFRLEQGGIEVG